jgi:hypothetical protein
MTIEMLEFIHKQLGNFRFNCAASAACCGFIDDPKTNKAVDAHMKKLSDAQKAIAAEIKEQKANSAAHEAKEK